MTNAVWKRSVLAALVVGMASAMPGAALADDKDGDGKFVEDFAKKPDANDAMTWNAAAGAVLSTGNTQQFTGNAGSDFTLVRGPHGFAAKAALVYGIADVNNGLGYEQNAFNINGKLRYDYFFTDMDSLFGAFVYRHDRFAGLDHRLQGQLGYQRFFIRDEKHKFWGEIGYDITEDRIYQENVVVGPPMVTTVFADWIDPVHAARLFVGYDNQLNEAVTFTTGAEFLMNLELPKDTRINWDNKITSKLVGSLSLEVGFLMQFDNVPVPGRKKLDTTTRLNLVYSLL